MYSWYIIIPADRGKSNSHKIIPVNKEIKSVVATLRYRALEF